MCIWKAGRRRSKGKGDGKGYGDIDSVAHKEKGRKKIKKSHV
jgi:hypothetical protein